MGHQNAITDQNQAVGVVPFYLLLAGRSREDRTMVTLACAVVAYLRSLFLPRHKRVLEAVALRDNGLNLSLCEQHRFPLSDVFRLSFPPSKLCAYRSRAGGAGFTAFHRAPGRRSRAGLAPVSRREKVPPRVQRMRADDLLAAVFPEALACQENIQSDIAISPHPLIREMMKDVLTEALDLEGLERVLGDIAPGGCA